LEIYAEPLGELDREAARALAVLARLAGEAQRLYSAKKRARGVLDFTDLLAATHRLLATRPALRKALADMPSKKVRVNVLRASIGAITQADVYLAAASNAIVVGFSVRPDKAAAGVAKDENVELRMYTVIYDLVDDIKNAMVGMLEPTLEEKVLGQAEVRQLFRVPKIGVVAGCYITDGKVTRNSELRLLRDNVVVLTGKVGSLRRFKDDVAEVKQGYECGIGIANYNDLKEGDVIESFVMEKVAQKTL